IFEVMVILLGPKTIAAVTMPGPIAASQRFIGTLSLLFLGFGIKAIAEFFRFLLNGWQASRLLPIHSRSVHWKKAFYPSARTPRNQGAHMPSDPGPGRPGFQRQAVWAY